MREDLIRLATLAQDVHGRVIRGTSSEFERARLLRDLQSLSTGLHRAAHQVGELGELIMTFGGDDPPPIGPAGGRAA